MNKSSHNGLKQKAAFGVFWSTAQRFSLIIVNFISSIILARLLSPEDYGMIGMLAIFILVADVFIDGGFGFAIIQKKQATEDDYSTVFYWNLGLAIVLYVALYWGAPLIADFYHVPLLSSILRVSGIILIINALKVIPECILKKELRFKKLSIIAVFASVLSLSITIWMAYSGYGVWSLVAQNLVFSLFTTVVYWITNRWYPKTFFSFKSFKELFSFGSYMLLNTLIGVIVRNIQGLLIGRLYNPALMGYYSKARSTEKMASETISQVISQVTFPIYAELQDQRERLINAIRKLTSAMSVVCFPLLFLLILLAKPLFILLYSSKWVDCVPYFQLLCIAGLATSMQSINSRAIVAIGKSKVFFYWGLLKQGLGLSLIVGGLVIGKLWGMLVGMVIQAWIVYFINAGLVSKYIGYKFNEQLFDIFSVLFISVIVYVCTYVIGMFLPYGMYVNALVELIVFTLIYMIIVFIFKKESLMNVRDLLSPFVERLSLKNHK